MRKVIVSEFVTLDGFFAGPHGELDWHNVDEEWSEFALRQLNEADTLLFGRVTYSFMAEYWTSSSAIEQDDPVIAEKMNSLNKVVFSKTLESVRWGDWNNARLAQEDLESEIASLKSQPGKDMLIFGSGSIVSALTQHNLIDEYRLVINPVVLGKGQPLFAGIPEQLELKLLNTMTFRSGNVLLSYQHAK